MEHLDNLKEPRSPASMGDLRLHEEKAAQQANVKSDSALKARQEAREDAVDMGVTAGTLIGGGVGALVGGGPIGATVGATAGGLAGKEIAEKLHDSTMEHLDNLKEPRSPASMDLRLHEEKAAQQAKKARKAAQQAKKARPSLDRMSDRMRRDIERGRTPVGDINSSKRIRNLSFSLERVRDFG